MKVIPVYHEEKIIGYRFHCPGCKCSHMFTKDVWRFNGNLNSPTFEPSLLCNRDYPESRCHSFVRDGKIQFLSDCYHELKNQTVELENIEEQN